MATVPLAHFSTYLGHMIKEAGINLTGRALNKKSLKLTNGLVPKKIIGNYEAILTFLCYFTRINYENRARKALKAFKLVNYSPLTFNLGMSFLTFSASTDDKIEKKPEGKVPSGFLLYDAKQDTPLSITVFDYTKPTNQSLIFPNKKIMVISFRGTISLSTAFKDLNISLQTLFNLYGKDAFSEEFAEVEQRKSKRGILGDIASLGTNPFGAHRGFVNGLIYLYPKIIARIDELLNYHPGISSIFITGHSLGGAFCELMGLGLAQLKKKGKALPDLHIVSFGAPKLFTDYARNVFNKLLLDGHMTFDRVASRPRFPDITMLASDPVPYIPPTLDHPGFMILKPEIMTQSRTGRTKHMREVRSELANINPDQSFLSSMIPNALKMRNYNPLPDYKEYLDHFLDCNGTGPNILTRDEYKGIINTAIGGTVRIRTGRAAKVFANASKALFITEAELEASSKVAEEAAKVEAAQGAKEAAALKGAVDSVVQEQKATEAEVEQAYGPGGLPQSGGAGDKESNTAIYKKQTVLEQPNHVVYSCSQITSGMPLVGCHLGYMGVGWNGALINVGSGTLTGSRDYTEVASLFCSDNGTWTYIPNYLPKGPDVPKKPAAAALTRRQNTNVLIKSLPNAAAAANEDPTAPNVQAGGTRRRGLFRKKSVSKKSVKTRRH
jgi:hypothetical protein